VVNDYKGAFQATEHLINSGYKKIAHVSGPQHINGFRDRMKGFLDALKKHKIKFDENFIYDGNISIESGKAAVDYFFGLKNIPDAVFAVEDYTALGIVKGLKERKIKIPEEFGVIGFANENFGEHISPSLSTVDQQTVQMGKEALGLLMNLIDKKEQQHTGSLQEKIVLEPLMHFRESSAGRQTTTSKKLHYLTKTTY
jgi:LacI family transcriptional regulator